LACWPPCELIWCHHVGLIYPHVQFPHPQMGLRAEIYQQPQLLCSSRPQ
jgi:hypothetical protein